MAGLIAFGQAPGACREAFLRGSGAGPAVAQDQLGDRRGGQDHPPAAAPRRGASLAVVDPARWMELRRGRMLEELAGELSQELAAVSRRPDGLADKLQRAREAEWPLEVTGYWVAACRRSGHAWRQIAQALRIGESTAERRFGPWVERFGRLASPRLGNIPAPPTSFVGRARELDELSRLLGASPLVTITGTAGVGKSRLAARALASANGPGPGDGCWWVELAALSDQEQICRAVADVLGIPEQPGCPMLVTLATVLGALEVLIVLDNCEHVLAACAELVSTWQRCCPGVSVLATSREPLGVAAELVWRVPPLVLPGEGGDPATNDAVRLFCERAAVARPGFSMDQDMDAVVDICRILDGLPLAIELAAARVSVLNPPEIAERLDDRFSLLADLPPSGELRYRSLRQALDWSYRLLSEREQRLFRRLSIFSSGFTLAAAEAVDGPESEGGSLVEPMAHLVGQSLVSVEASRPDVRYRLLETMRVYGRERLVEAGEDDGTAWRHAQWCKELAERAEPELTGPRQRVWLERMSCERANCAAAMGWYLDHGESDPVIRLATSMTLVYRMRSQFSEGRQWLERALASGPTPSELLRAKALWGVGFLAMMAGDQERASEALSQSLALARELGDDQATARCLLISANALPASRAAEAVALFEESAEIARRAGDTWCLSHALALMGSAWVGLDQPVPARAALEEGIAVARQARDPQGQRIGILLLADLLLAEGDLAQAEELIEEALALVRSLGEPYGVGVAQMKLTLVYLGRGAWDVAARSIDRALEQARRVGCPSLTAYGRCLLGRHAQAGGDLRLAMAAYEEALEVQGSPPWLQTMALQGLGEVALLSGDRGTARAHLEATVGSSGAGGAAERQARALFWLGELERTEREADKGWALHAKALQLRSSGVVDRAGVADSLEALARLAPRRRRPQYAVRLLGAADAIRHGDGLVRWPDLVPAHEAEVAALKAQLGQAAFDVAWRAGAQLSLQQAVARALGTEAPPGCAKSGLSSLTPTERRVTALAAQGLSNPEIGRKLLMSRFTARAHLSAAYAKLQVSSRKDLVQALSRSDT